MKGLLSRLLLVLGTLTLPALAAAADYAGKKVLFIDSYHAGYPWSDGITKGVRSGFEGTGVELKVLRLDTKRNKDEAFKQKAALEAKAVIESFGPDVVIAADDNASKYLIAPHYRDAELPFVFCGVNWDAGVYGYPYKNATGMVEVSGAKELVELLSGFAGGQRIGFLAEDTLTERKEAENYATKLGIDVKPVFVATFDEWKQKYRELQDQVDMLILGNFAGMSDFDLEAAKAWATQHAKIPSGAVQEGPDALAMIGYLKVPEEQGYWSAQTALKILDGAQAGTLPIAQNREGSVVINMRIAQAIGVELPYSLLESATKVIE